MWLCDGSISPLARARSTRNWASCGRDPQRRRDVVGPEVGAQRRHQQRVEYRLIQPAQPLDQREAGRLRDRGRGRFAFA